jgi:hypothetical protein
MCACLNSRSDDVVLRLEHLGTSQNSDYEQTQVFFSDMFGGLRVADVRATSLSIASDGPVQRVIFPRSKAKVGCGVRGLTIYTLDFRLCVVFYRTILPYIELLLPRPILIAR